MSITSDPGPAQAIRHDASFLSRLTTGTGAFNVLGRRKYYYIFSSILVLASLLFIIFRGFNFGIDFAGGTRLTFQPAAATSPSIAQVAQVFKDATGQEATVQTIGQQHTIQISSETLSLEETAAAKKALTAAFQPPGGLTGVSDAAVSGTWGSEISLRAAIAVIIFLVLVGVFIWIRYEKRVAVGAVASTIHDVLVTAGIYAAVGFEVTPATVIGLLTILGFSLYDTVVVYDKVQENSKGFLSLTRRTYPEAANLAVNQTLMRSINTSLIALLPVAGLLVAGVALLGSGTLKDLSLVLLVGMLVGAYSSVFVAVPLAVDLKMREPQIRAHTAKVVAKRKAEGLIVDADGDPVGRKGGPAVGLLTDPADRSVTRTGVKPVAPRPGVKPVRPGKPARATTTAAPVGGSTRASAGKVQVTKSAQSAATSLTPTDANTPTTVSASTLSVPAATPATVPVATPSAVPAAMTTPPATPAKVPAPATPAKKPAPGQAARPTGQAARPTGQAARPTGKAARPSGKRGR